VVFDAPAAKWRLFSDVRQERARQAVGLAWSGEAAVLGRHMVCVSYDKNPRMIRDIRLSLQHCARGSLLKFQLFSDYIWGIKHKPFNSGAFSEQKARLFNVFRFGENGGSQYV
jgi:hypothetical protein